MRLWPRSEGVEDETGAVNPPADIAGILDYSMEGGSVPTGVTIPSEEDISSRRVSFLVRGDDGGWDRL